jgi:hypothetical protein
MGVKVMLGGRKCKRACSNRIRDKPYTYMAMVHLEAPVLDPAVAVDAEGLYGELGHLVLRLALEVGQQPGLQHEVAHVDEGPPDLAAAVPDHPPLVDHGRRRRRHIEDEDGACLSYRCFGTKASRRRRDTSSAAAGAGVIQIRRSVGEMDEAARRG